MPKIALVNTDGQTVGAKMQSALTPDDMYHGIFVLLITPARQVIASQLANKKLSATAVTICRDGESPEAAARRALKQTTNKTPALHHLGDQFYTQPNGCKIYMSVLYGVATIHDGAKDCALLTREECADQPDRYTPALQFILHHYHHALPI